MRIEWEPSARIFVGGMYGGLRSLISDLGELRFFPYSPSIGLSRSWELKKAKFAYTAATLAFHLSMVPSPKANRLFGNFVEL